MKAAIEHGSTAMQCEALQLVEVSLNQGEWIIAESAALMYMEQGIHHEVITGDEMTKKTGLFDRLVIRGKFIKTDKQVQMNLYRNHDSISRKIVFCAPDSDRILPIDLSAFDNLIVCQKEAFLCAAKGVSVDRTFQRKYGAGLFGDNDFTMECIHGDGQIYLGTSGTVLKRQLSKDETVRVDSACLLAMSGQINYDVQEVGDSSGASDGSGVAYFTSLSGPGTVWIQSHKLKQA